MQKWLLSAQPSRYILHIKQPLSNPYVGLALEEHWFNTLKFEENANVEKKLILLWRNQPSVVVGKFQNVWKECHTGFCRAHGIHVARRSSGGGTESVRIKLMMIKSTQIREVYNLDLYRKILKKGKK